MKNKYLSFAFVFFFCILLPSVTLSIPSKTSRFNMSGGNEVVITMIDANDDGLWDHAVVWLNGDYIGSFGPFLKVNKPSNTPSNYDGAFEDATTITMNVFTCLDSSKRIDFDFYNANATKFAEFRTNCNNSTAILYNIDGVSYKTVIDINEMFDVEIVSISPNPVIDNLKVVYQIKNTGKMNLRNSLGENLIPEIILESKMGIENIDLSKLPSGLYLITIESVNGVLSKKVVISK